MRIWWADQAADDIRISSVHPLATCAYARRLLNSMPTCSASASSTAMRPVWTPFSSTGCAAAVCAGLRRVGTKLGVGDADWSSHGPSQPVMFQVSLEMNAEFRVSAEQTVIGVGCALLIGGLLYFAAQSGQ